MFTLDLTEVAIAASNVVAPTVISALAAWLVWALTKFISALGYKANEERITMARDRFRSALFSAVTGAQQRAREKGLTVQTRSEMIAEVGGYLERTVPDALMTLTGEAHWHSPSAVAVIEHEVDSAIAPETPLSAETAPMSLPDAEVDEVISDAEIEELIDPGPEQTGRRPADPDQQVFTRRMPVELKPSDGYVALIKKGEGLRLKAYQDTGGVWTIGYGHTRTARQGMVITKAEAEALLMQDTEVAINDINEMVEVPLYQNEYDALVSFVFNIGGQQFRNSTLLQVLNDEAYAAVPSELRRWVYDNGVRIQGLANRREKEIAVWLA